MTGIVTEVVSEISTKMTISVFDKDQVLIAQGTGDQLPNFSYEHFYEEGDVIEFFGPMTSSYWVISTNASMEETVVYVPSGQFRFSVPFGEELACYAPKAFTGKTHLILLRFAQPSEIMRYRNLALNPADRPNTFGAFPHAISNNETRGESVFAARNVIDGLIESSGHGFWPYTSWGPDISSDASLTISFGRKVIIDQIKLMIRTDFPHDSYWTEGVFSFSDGTEKKVRIQKQMGSQQYCFDPVTTEWVQLSRLKKAKEDAEFPALVQLEAWGYDAYNS